MYLHKQRVSSWWLKCRCTASQELAFIQSILLNPACGILVGPPYAGNALQFVESLCQPAQSGEWKGAVGEGGSKCGHSQGRTENATAYTASHWATNSGTQPDNQLSGPHRHQADSGQPPPGINRKSTTSAETEPPASRKLFTVEGWQETTGHSHWEVMMG